jgi:hypothetical protein
MNGYWVFAPMLGYRYESVPGQGKMPVRDEPNASVVQEALKGFVSGRFQSPVAVQRFPAKHPSTPRNWNGEVSLKNAINLLNGVIYAGYMTIESWDLHMHPGKHEGPISLLVSEEVVEIPAARAV